MNGWICIDGKFSASQDTQTSDPFTFGVFGLSSINGRNAVTF
jgi:hypothetical protein